MTELHQRTALYAPSLTVLERQDWTFMVDGDAPNWIATDRRGAWLMSSLREGPANCSQLVARYAQHTGLETVKAWLHVDTFVREALRYHVLTTTPDQRQPYLGRAHHLALTRLRECWLHTNNICNLRCAHCLVNSSPQGDKGLPTAFWKQTIDQAVAVGVDRFYITGGEPFARDDMAELVRYITETRRIELIVLTNATLFTGARQRVLEPFDRELVKFQVSVDGSTPELNDRVRGQGSLAATIAGMRELTRRGFDTTITAVAMGMNLHDLPNITRLAAECGVRNQHLMWAHRRGRAIEHDNGFFPSTGHLIDAIRAVKSAADQRGIILDNAVSFALRANAPAGIKFDLGNAGWQSLCVYADGQVYPSAALANHQPLQCGDLRDGVDLEQVWRQSPMLQRVREASVIHKQEAATDPFRYLTGGGDVEHSYFYSGDFTGEDPYYPVYQALLLDAMDALARRKVALDNQRSGYDAPRIYHAMGDGAVACGTTEVGAEDVEVAFLHSNCVLSFDVEKPRKIVQQFYGQAAEQPQAALCCPTKYQADEVAHIPQGVLDRFYGCGSPVTAARLQPGEVYVDLGAGAGIDCFIAAKHVGSSGQVIGIDMTDQMLAVARDNQQQVAAALGYDVVEFRKGYLEDIPVASKTADVVTSNCVINLSPDKPAVCAEVWRILADHGRAVIADIVSDRAVPPQLKVNEQLWGECIVGALTEEQFLAMLEQAGFYGLSVLEKVFWKAIEGYRFYSVTVQGFKFEKTQGCHYIGQTAIYHGPLKAVMDEEGHLFPRNIAVTVCTDTAAKLHQPPYRAWFTVVPPGAQDTHTAVAFCAEADGHACC